MALIVVKFGGTSLSTPPGIERSLKIIEKHREKGKSLVVVVSALGRNGEPYATDTFLTMLEEANPRYSIKERDLLLSCGEIISAVLMSERLKEKGIDATSFTGGMAGIITGPSSFQTHIKAIYPSALQKALSQGSIPVVAGFQGITWDGEVTTLGRGGSDITATALGAALDAHRVEIYTDVEGMMTGDPRIIPSAKILDHVSFTDACEMSYQGARVIHSRAIEMARKYRLPVKIAGTFSQKKGSLIASSSSGENPVTGVASRSDVVFFFLKEAQNRKKIRDVFLPLAQEGVSLDFINLSQEEVCFLVDEEKERITQDILEREGFAYGKENQVVKISIVGGGMTGLPGVMVSLVKSLDEAGVEIYRITDSLTTISALIRREKESMALQALHSSFGLDNTRKENEDESR